jgi:hypothetical protein
MRDPQHWVVRQLRSGKFCGLNVGRKWFMTDAGIEAAIAACENRTPNPAMAARAFEDEAPAVLFNPLGVHPRRQARLPQFVGTFGGRAERLCW